MIQRYSNTQSSKYRDIFIFLLIIFSLNFFSATIAHFGILKNISYGYSFGALLVSLPYFLRKGIGLVLPVQVISISVIFSIFMAYITWGQSLDYSASTIPYTTWFIFFYLLNVKYPTYKLETIVIFYGFIYIILFLYQFSNSNVVIFGYKEEFSIDRGITRVNFPGGGVFFLAYFIALNKSSEKIKFRWIFIGFVILGVIVTILQVTRQNILIIIISLLYHNIKNKSALVKATTIGLTFAITIFIINLENPVSRGLRETQNETFNDGSKYIRVLSAEYFIKDFSPDLLSRIFGNGFPNNTSNYGKFAVSLEEKYGFFLSDVGLIGFYVMFGIFSVICYVIILIKTLSASVPNNYYYLKYYMWFLLTTCLTSDYIYSYNFLITNVIVIYSFQTIYEQNSIKNYLIKNHKAIQTTSTFSRINN